MLVSSFPMLSLFRWGLKVSKNMALAVLGLDWEL